MPTPESASAYYRAQQKVSISTVVLARRLWAKLGAGDFDSAWRALGPQLLVVLAAGQRAAVARAVDYVPAVLGELNVEADPVARVVGAALTGVASDGRPLDSLLYQSVVAARVALGRGATLPQALRSGGSVLDQIVSTQVADAGRAAESVATAVRPDVKIYVRMLVLPSCDDCVILAGRRYAWNADFDRHPQCNCRQLPCSEAVAGDLTVDPVAAIRSGQVTGLSRRDRQAIIEDGADPGRVVNAKREGALSTQQVLGQRLKVTTEGTSRRTGNHTVTTVIDGKRVKVRLRPDAIYKIADGNRAEAIRLLKLYGYAA